jgi:uncharacterized membrane protein
MSVLSTKFTLTAEDEKLIVAAIRNAESNTSGEIKVHIESSSQGDPFDRGLEMFVRLGLRKTHLRNGVLIYVATEDRQFAIIADEGIDRLVPENFWEGIKHKMKQHFGRKQFVQGIIAAVSMTGEQLKLHFPHAGENDRNELSDEVSKGK